MKVGDLVAYSWNPKERPDEVQLAIVLDTEPNMGWPATSEPYIQIHLQSVDPPSFLTSPLCVPRFKLDVLSEAR